MNECIVWHCIAYHCKQWWVIVSICICTSRKWLLPTPYLLNMNWATAIAKGIFLRMTFLTWIWMNGYYGLLMHSTKNTDEWQFTFVGSDWWRAWWPARMSKWWRSAKFDSFKDVLWRRERGGQRANGKMVKVWRNWRRIRRRNRKMTRRRRRLHGAGRDTSSQSTSPFATAICRVSIVPLDAE